MSNCGNELCLQIHIALAHKMVYSGLNDGIATGIGHNKQILIFPLHSLTTPVPGGECSTFFNRSIYRFHD